MDREEWSQNIAGGEFSSAAMRTTAWCASSMKVTHSGLPAGTAKAAGEIFPDIADGEELTLVNNSTGSRSKFGKFTFLGFDFYWARSRRNPRYVMVKRRTNREKFRTPQGDRRNGYASPLPETQRAARRAEAQAARGIYYPIQWDIVESASDWDDNKRINEWIEEQIEKANKAEMATPRKPSD